ncbi:hypothetical protein OsccyDRAFT_4651 [Leptolyngbyaceae cyanobacterium JSC-12]|nr:hypothetical protein OsccyDRAFT_4651 [Leptolyngbyaceae cyanobacterium JSC-12]
MTFLEHLSIALNPPDHLQAEMVSLLHAQRCRLSDLGSAMRKWLGQLIASAKRPRRDRRNIGRLYFGWFGGVQFFYSQESKP